ncbi:hypothetical protein [Emticicia sp. TH156]|uniref:hypothetical protein n=1 Tax=Emticicia sp. TH156 TaxID=2067454 RepID=UPI000C7942F7|nr:hypothetical protein [Emticicia sp. TH156]PLK42651.1 hypothetical protein C0V77_19125 [Emticicia sp. TH156]
MKKMLITLFLLGIIASKTQAQQMYGGSAFVFVKNDKGITRVLNATETCNNSSYSQVQSKLETSLRYIMGSREEFSSQIYYTVDRCVDGDGKMYGGAASVKVKDLKSGRTRFINATESCQNASISGAKRRLETSLKSVMSLSEEFETGISYDIDGCSR